MDPYRQIVTKYEKLRQYSNGFDEEIKSIFLKEFGFVIEESNKENDMLHCFDFQTLDGKIKIAARIRNAKYFTFQDVTLRSRTQSGQNKTELDKIQNSDIDLYFWGWEQDNKITKWLIADGNRIKELLKIGRKEIKNTDNSTFITLKFSELSPFIKSKGIK